VGTQLPTHLIGPGGIVRTVRSQSNTYVSVSATIPGDDTIPQSGEGTEVLSVSITPQSASNILYVDVFIHAATGSGATGSAALFKDSEADARQAQSMVGAGADPLCILAFTYAMTAGSTALTTFKVRIGPTSSAMYFNGFVGARRFGGAQASYIRVTEVAA
jgi:hypothetical protein